MNFNEVSFEYAAGTVNQLPVSDLPEIVFSGHSNVGKSSLLNKLVQRKALARVSAQPGFIGCRIAALSICRDMVTQRSLRQRRSAGQVWWRVISLQSEISS